MNIAIVVPCFNEEDRLNIDIFIKFLENNQKYFILFVDDGSTDNTKNLIKSNIKNRMELFSLKKNSGKGEAIRQGFLYILENYNDITHIAFWDADLSVPLEEILLFFKYDNLYAKSADAIFGSRIKRLGSNISRSKYRHWLSRIFITVINFLIKDIKSYDSQCGAKIFSVETARKVFDKPFISSWIFDIEIQLRMKDCYLLEYPVTEWTEIHGSKINFFKTAFRVLKDIRHIRKEYR